MSTEHTRHILDNLSPREWLRSMMLGFPVPDHRRDQVEMLLRREAERIVQRAPRWERRRKGRKVA